ncbi:MAG: VCBS repeat-containing protein [Candidatus Zixiibacteriota bacterium]|nr:MAG: VCBS repeat-containing protein [candidate division Zixibacteria bacterium]
MRQIFIRLVLVLCGVCSGVYGQDIGIKDTVRLEGQAVKVGQSSPISLYLINDGDIEAISFGLMTRQVDSGMITFDSVVFINRMADPSVLLLRIVRFYSDDGIHPDTLLIAGFRMGANDIPVGNDAICHIYVTGVNPGKIRIDSTFVPPGSPFSLIGASSNSTKHYPEFGDLVLDVLTGLSPPVIVVPEEIQPVAVASLVSFEIDGGSPEGFPVTTELVSLRGLEDTTLLPQNQPVLSQEIPALFEWTPSNQDIGLWRAEFRLCDSTGNCDTGEVLIQVVADESFLVVFSCIDVPDTLVSMDIKTGNFDDDPYSEIFVTGLGALGSPSLELFDYQDGTIAQVYSYDDGYPKWVAQPGYLDTDDILDIAVRDWAPMAGQVLILKGNGDNTFSVANEHGPIPSFRSTTLGEFTGDNRLDLITVGSNDVTVLAGQAAYSFQQVNTFEVADVAITVNAADFNLDGCRDLAIGTASGLEVHLGDGTGGFSFAQFYDQVYGALDIDVTNQGSDFNHDGLFDLVLATPSIGGTSSQIMAYLGNGDGSFDQVLVRNVRGQVFSTRAGDFNGDKNLDIAFMNGAGRYLGILFGDGSGAFPNELRYDVPNYEPHQLAATDIDLDGDLDLVTPSFQVDIGASLFVFFNENDPEGLQQLPLLVQGCDNAAVELVSSTGRTVSSISNSMAAAGFYFRDINDNDYIDNQAEAGVLEAGPYSINVSPRPDIVDGETYNLEYFIDGLRYRLAGNLAMSQDGYSFTIYPTNSEVAPASGRFIYNAKTCFRWPGSGAFEFQLAQDIDFQNLLVEAVTAEANLELDTPLVVTDTIAFFWRVKPIGQQDYAHFYVFNLIPSDGSQGDLNGDAVLDIGDLTLLIAYLFIDGEPPSPVEAANYDQTGIVDISDLTFLIAYLFLGGEPPFN